MGIAPRDATVLAQGTQTRYTRRGSGPALLVLLDEGRDDVLDDLATAFKVIVPEIPRDADLTRWLRGLLEGLGMRPVAVLAAQDPDLIRGVATLTADTTPREHHDALRALWNPA